jgi:alkylation response protein AidB-like acyl-CoA dehydrogenase
VLDAVEERLRETERLDGEARRRLLGLRGELEAARLLSFRAADTLDRGLPGSATSAMAKLAGARLMQRVGNESIDLLGLEGLGDASPEAVIGGRAAALYRASVASTIAGGTAEVQQLVIARRGLGLQ